MARRVPTSTPTQTRSSPGTTVPVRPTDPAAPGVPIREITLQEDEVRRRAYEIYLRRASGTGGAGDAASDWYEAERELRAEKVRKLMQSPGRV